MSDLKLRYKLDAKPLGIGGFADVFGAVDKETGARVALKRLRYKGPHKKEGLARMKREIDVQRSLVHPNIMPILHSDDGGDPTWFTMPVASHDVSKKRAELAADPNLLLAMVEDVVAALVYSHASGHVHRDLSPSNVLLLEGRWVLADWGLVRRPPGETTTLLTHHPMGHPPYMAPEAFVDSHDLGPAADIYGLGRVIAYVLTGRVPSPVVPLVPEILGWRNVITRMTASDPRQRPGTSEIVKLVTDSLNAAETSPARIRDLLSAERPDPVELLHALSSVKPEREFDIFVRILPKATVAVVEAMVRDRPADAVLLASRISGFLLELNAHGIDWDSMNGPLATLLMLCRAASRLGALSELGDLAEHLFRAGVRWDRYASRSSVQGWLGKVRGASAGIVATALVRAEAGSYYGRGFDTISAEPAVLEALEL